MDTEPETLLDVGTGCSVAVEVQHMKTHTRAAHESIHYDDPPTAGRICPTQSDEHI